jgi:hypothetical protein
VVAVRVGEPRWVAILATRSVYGPTISAAEYNTVRLISVSLNIHFAHYTQRGGAPDWNNRSLSVRLGFSVGHAVRVCEFLPSCECVVDPPPFEHRPSGRLEHSS